MSILRVGRTCKVAHQAVALYIKRAFNINRLLKRFFSEVIAFRTLQARTGTLISGSVALQFFDREFYPCSDLDLYVHMRHRREVGRWLMQHNYCFVPATHQAVGFEEAATEALSGLGENLYGMPGVAAILNFVREEEGTVAASAGNTSSALKVQLIVSRRTPMEVILGFHSSESRHVI